MGAVLPETFLQQDWTGVPASPELCVRYPAPPVGCQARMDDIDRDGRPEILLRVSNYEVQVYRENEGPRWTLIGKFSTSDCDTSKPLDFATSAISLAPPSLAEIEFNGRRHRLVEACTPATPK